MDKTLIWVVIGIGLSLLTISTSISQLRSDVTRMNLTLSKIAEQVGVPDTITDELKALLLDGKKIEAIKKYRVATGLGLKEAKEYVDLLSEQQLK